MYFDINEWFKDVLFMSFLNKNVLTCMFAQMLFVFCLCLIMKNILFSTSFCCSNVVFYCINFYLHPLNRPVLSKVREKSSVLLPGWVSVPVTVVEETPVSQMSQVNI